MRFTNVQFAHGEEITVSFRNQNASKTIVDGQPIFYIDAGIILADNNQSPASYYGPTNYMGIDATTPSDISSQQTSKWSLFAGIAKNAKTVGFPPGSTNPYVQGTASYAVGDVGEAVCYGFTQAIITMRTRLTSTDSWASIAAFSAGDQMIPETIGNGLSWAGTLPQGLAFATVGAGTAVTVSLGASLLALPPVVAGQSQASIQSNVSTYGATNLLADTYRMLVFVRAM